MIVLSWKFRTQTILVFQLTLSLATQEADKSLYLKNFSISPASDVRYNVLRTVSKELDLHPVDLPPSYIHDIALSTWAW